MCCWRPWFTAASKKSIFSHWFLEVASPGPWLTSSSNVGPAVLDLRRGGDWASANPPRVGLAIGDMGQALLGGAGLGLGATTLCVPVGIPREGRLVAAAGSLGTLPHFGEAGRDRELTDCMLPVFERGGMLVHLSPLEPVHQ